MLDNVLRARCQENTQGKWRVLDTGHEDVQQLRYKLRGMVCAFIKSVDDKEDCRVPTIDLADGLSDQILALVLHLLVFSAPQVLPSSIDDGFPECVLSVGKLIRESWEEHAGR